MPSTAIVVLSHGDLARGLVEAARMIAGDQPGLRGVGLEEGEGPESFRATRQNMGARDLALHLMKVSPATMVDVGRLLLEEAKKEP